MTGSISSALFLFAFCLGLFVGLVIVPTAISFHDRLGASGDSAAQVAGADLVDKASTQE